MLRASTILILVLVASFVSLEASPWSGFPRDGRFKKLATKADPWFFVDDEHWPIRAPDKWQHFSGCYLTQRLLQGKIGKTKAFLLTESIGILKELDDAYREGWSLRDLIFNNLGIFSAMTSSEKIKFTCSYDSEKLLFQIHFLLR